MRRIGLGVMMAVLAMSASLHAASGSTLLGGGAKKGDELTGRAKISKLIRRDLKSTILIERVNAIRELGSETDKALIAEFGVLRVLTDIATDVARFPRERYEALRAQVTLYQNGIGNPEVLTTLAEMVETNKTPPIVRLGALGLLGEMGSFEGPIAMKAFYTLEDMWKKRRQTRNRLPVPILAKIMDAVGGFHAVEKTEGLLLEGLDEDSPAIRAGALSGLQKYLEASGRASNTLLREVQGVFSRASTRAERTEAIRVLELLVQNDPDTAEDLANSTRETLMAVLANGEDVEVQASVRLLLRVPQEAILKAILSQAKPRRDRKPTLSYETYYLLNAGLTEALNGLRENSTRNSSRALADDILNHFIWILDPANEAPIVLRKAAVFGLGSWPMEFDRQKVVMVLIRLLEVAQAEDLIEETEKALLFLTGQDPFRTRDAESQRMSPDVAAWRNHYQQIKQYLEPGETPVIHIVE